jgi:hypothetical protein
MEEIEMNKWAQSIYDHLERYKIHKWNDDKKVKFRDKLYGHILPENLKEENYMSSIVKEEAKNIKKHMYWHHLNSSQTMCLNFFVPLIKNNLLSIFFKKVLNLNVDIIDNKFEYTPEAGGTNFDFYVKDSKDKNYYFEIKYTEADINKKTSVEDPFHRHEVFMGLYNPKIKKNKLFVSAHIDEDTFMLEHYQAYRNMVEAINGDYSIFITMSGNPGTEKEFKSATEKLGLITKEDQKKNFILLLHWEDVVAKTQYMIDELGNKELADYYEEFFKKYIDLGD